jgi:hypothetical protein
MSEVQNVEGKEKEDWMQQKWRPAMGWMYMCVCICDFVIFPVLWSVLQALGNHGHVETQWSPITLNGAGLFHMAMGAVLGIAAYGRTQEKMAGAAGGNGSPTIPSFGTPSNPSFNQAPQSSYNNAPLGGNSLSTTPAFNSAPAPSFSPAPAPAFGSSKPVAPPPAAQPEL